MNCPDCGSVVEEGADLCMECGEPIGDSVAARIARADGERARVEFDREGETRRLRDAALPPPPSPTAITVKLPPVKLPLNVDEPEPVRCLGCGVLSRAVRCPGCGAPLRRDE